MSADERRDTRYRICTGLVLQVGKRNVFVTSGDIGLRGLFIRTTEPLKQNEFVRMSVRVPWSGETLTMFGRVAHLRGPVPKTGGAGVELYGNDRSNLEVWEAFVKEAARRFPESAQREVHLPPPLPAARVAG